MDKTEVKKLKALLTHWIEHTEEHSDEFEEWAQKFNSSRYGICPGIFDNCLKRIR
jgi:hypothetical protein